MAALLRASAVAAAAAAAVVAAAAGLAACSGPAASGPSAGPVQDRSVLPYALAGRHDVGWRRVVVARQDGTQFGATVYYPAVGAIENAAVAPLGGPFPAVSFGHGFLQKPSRYAETLRHLASWGFVVIASESEVGLSPDHQQLALDMIAALDFLEQGAGDPASWLHGHVDVESFGVSGHSMGGGASILAAAEDRRIHAVANLAAAETRPSAVDAMARLEAPVHFIVGSQDAIVPPTSTRRMYQAGGPPKIFTSIVGGWHCGFESDPFPVGCDRGDMPRQEQLAITAHLLTAFFLVHLAEDRGALPYVWGAEASADPRMQRLADPGAGAVPSTYRSSPSGRPTTTTSAALPTGSTSPG